MAVGVRREQEQEASFISMCERLNVVLEEALDIAAQVIGQPDTMAGARVDDERGPPGGSRVDALEYQFRVGYALAMELKQQMANILCRF